MPDFLVTIMLQSFARAGHTLTVNPQLWKCVLQLSLCDSLSGNYSGLLVENKITSKVCVNPYTDCTDGALLSDLNSHFLCYCTYSAVVSNSNEETGFSVTGSLQSHLRSFL